MSLSKEAIQYLQESNILPENRHIYFEDEAGKERHFIINAQGQAEEIYPDLGRAEESIRLHTLTGFVDYIKANIDRKDKPFFINIFNEEYVELQSPLLSDGSREKLAMAQSIVPDFHYGHYYDVEEMLINFQSKFIETPDREILLKVIGNIQEENVRTTGDNGISQVVSMKQGVASTSDAVVPNPVNLAPYRTFLEVDQPKSDFIFRMQNGPKGAVFEADGGAWRNQAIANIRDYLAQQLESEIAEDRIITLA